VLLAGFVEDVLALYLHLVAIIKVEPKLMVVVSGEG